MPTYEYRCPACDNRFELFQRMNDTPGAPCPACGAAAERQLSAGAGFLFKGDGFYITDYRSADYRKKAAAESGKGTGGDTAKSGESKGDAKGGGDSGSGSAATPKTGESGGKTGGGSSTPSGPSSPAPAGD